MLMIFHLITIFTEESNLYINLEQYTVWLNLLHFQIHDMLKIELN